MDEDKLREIFESIDPEGKISPERIDGFIQAVKESEINPPKEGEEKDGLYFNTLDNLKVQLANEPDWKKRAVIAAKIISRNLE